MNKTVRFALVPVLGALSALPAMAQTSGAIDVTAITAKVADQATPVAAIGAAVLLLFVGIKAFKWVRKALS